MQSPELMHGHFLVSFLPLIVLCRSLGAHAGKSWLPSAQASERSDGIEITAVFKAEFPGCAFKATKKLEWKPN